MVEPQWVSEKQMEPAQIPTVLLTTGHSELSRDSLSKKAIIRHDLPITISPHKLLKIKLPVIYFVIAIKKDKSAVINKTK